VEERTVILKEALQRLEQSQEELSEALKERQLNEIKSRFVSMASHEFRTPLSTVLSSASLLARYTTTEEQDRTSICSLPFSGGKCFKHPGYGAWIAYCKTLSRFIGR
jgi:signal transduction histidine kinase